MTLDVYGGLYDDDLEDLADRLEARWAAQRGTEGAQLASLSQLNLESTGQTRVF